MKRKLLFVVACAWAMAGIADDPHGGHGGHAMGELKQGRYAGTIQLDSSRKKIAVVGISIWSLLRTLPSFRHSMHHSK